MPTLVARTWALTAVFLASAAIAAGADQDRSDTAGKLHRSGIEFMQELSEHLAAMFDDRTKQIGFDDPFAQSCPTATSLASSAGDSFGFVVPQYSLRNAADPGHRFMFFSLGPENSPDFGFFNDKCSYVVTVRRFEISRDGEREIHPKPVDYKRKQEQMARDLRVTTPAEKPQPDPPQTDVATANAATSSRPLDGGVWRMGMTFGPSVSQIDFSGILCFAPWSVSAYLVNVPKNLTLEARKNPELRAYEIDVRTPEARLRFSVVKKVNVDGLWVKAFSE